MLIRVPMFPHIYLISDTLVTFLTLFWGRRTMRRRRPRWHGCTPCQMDLGPTTSTSQEMTTPFCPWSWKRGGKCWKNFPSRCRGTRLATWRMGWLPDISNSSTKATFTSTCSPTRPTCEDGWPIEALEVWLKIGNGNYENSLKRVTFSRCATVGRASSLGAESEVTRGLEDAGSDLAGSGFRLCPQLPTDAECEAAERHDETGADGNARPPNERPSREELHPRQLRSEWTRRGFWGSCKVGNWSQTRISSPHFKSNWMVLTLAGSHLPTSRPEMCSSVWCELTIPQRWRPLR